MNLQKKVGQKTGPLETFGYGTDYFPRLEGDISKRMKFNGKEMLVWSLNNYLSLANHPKVREADAKAAKDYGLANPMGSRMMSGNSVFHEELERRLSEITKKEDSILVNYGYQGIISAIQALVDRHDIIIYDAQSHACILDGVHLHLGHKYKYNHNDVENLKLQLQRANKKIDKKKGGVLVITEGIFGMTGHLGKLKEISQLKKEFDFTLLVDDAHGFGVMGENGGGTGIHLDSQDEVDIYFSTFAKSMAAIGGFFSGKKEVIKHLRFNMRSLIFAKTLPMPFVQGLLTRLDILEEEPELRKKLWDVTRILQSKLLESGYKIGNTQAPVTPIYLAAGNTEEASKKMKKLREEYNVFCSAVTYPVVPKGIVLLRIIPTAEHNTEDVEYTINALNNI